MASRKMNVLVYTGTGTTIDSVRHCTHSLRRLLSPNYAVIPITEATLLKEPWAPTCALLVLPGGADLGYCRALGGAGNRLIAQYVRRGGAYLGFCAGGYYGSARCEFEVGNRDLEVVGTRELAFFPGTCRGGAFKGFAYESERGARAARVLVRKDALLATAGAVKVPDEFRCYVNGGGVFVDADADAMAAKGIEVVASYGEATDVDGGEKDSAAAIVFCKVGEGRVMLTGPHPEFAAVNLSRQPDVPGYDKVLEALAEDDEARVSFFKACLLKLGLEVNPDPEAVPSLSRLHLSSLARSGVSELLHSFTDAITVEDGEEFIKGEHDIFHMEKPESRWSMQQVKDALDSTVDADLTSEKEKGQEKMVDYAKITKSIVSHEEGWPEPRETPHFNHAIFYSSLTEYRQKEPEAEEWGDLFMYGEVLTSTNTVLEKNPKLLANLPTGFTLSATTQVAGRGRGSNVWVSPAGSLIMSTVINHPAHLAVSRPIVFIQYLAGIATVEAIQSYDLGYGDLPVKLKWPNDIYARDPSKPTSAPPSYVKIGGILANCNYDAASRSYQVVLGIGVNTTNGRPTTSLDALLHPLNESRARSPPGQQQPPLAPFRIERLTARILARLEAVYGQFCREGFGADLERRYYAHWLHTGQVVTLEAEGGVRARVVGITRDWGMLRAEELRADEGDGHRGVGGRSTTGRVWALQSDENSFDFWRGLVRRKV